MQSDRMLSSKLTFTTKFIVPTIWTVAFGMLTAHAWLGRLHDKTGRTAPEFMQWLFLFVLVIGGAAIWRSCMRLKKVRLSSNDLLISNYRREITVPLANVNKVTLSKFTKGQPITIHFKRPTDFGSRVTFMPATTIGWKSPEAIVSELRKLIL